MFITGTRSRCWTTSCRIGIPIVFVISLIVGLTLLFKVYLPSRYDNRYSKAECTIIDNRITNDCYINNCKYFGYIHLIYYGEINNINGNFEVLSSIKNKEEAESIMREKYYIGANKTCYYPTERNLGLEMKRPTVNDDESAKLGVGFALTIAGLSLLFGILAFLPYRYC